MSKTKQQKIFLIILLARHSLKQPLISLVFILSHSRFLSHMVRRFVGDNTLSDPLIYLKTKSKLNAQIVKINYTLMITFFTLSCVYSLSHLPNLLAVILDVNLLPTIFSYF